MQSWLELLEQNGVTRNLAPYHSNLNQRLIKTPKLYFEDTGLTVRLQGWKEYNPILLSPYFGNLVENLALSEITRFFTNSGEQPTIFFVRSKEQVEIDFLLQLSNQRFITMECKVTPCDLTKQQVQLIDSLQLNIIDR